MNSTFKNLLLSAALIAVPAGGFSLAEMVILPSAQTTSAPAQSPGLGDLSAYKTIVTDTQAIAATGDLTAAEHRINDLETLWDQNAAASRQADRGRMERRRCRRRRRLLGVACGLAGQSECGHRAGHSCQHTRRTGSGCGHRADPIRIGYRRYR